MSSSQPDFGLICTTQPTVEPVTVAEAKARLRITSTADDADIATMISQARQKCENYCRRAFLDQTWTYTLRRFPCENGGAITLPRPRLRSITSLKYLNSSGVLTTLAATTGYIVTTAREPAAIYPAYGTSWPATRDTIEAVQVVYVAGYGAAAVSVPDAIKAAVLMMVGHLDEFRAAAISGTIIAEVPLGVASFLSPYKAHWSP